MISDPGDILFLLIAICFMNGGKLICYYLNRMIYIEINSIGKLKNNYLLICFSSKANTTTILTATSTTSSSRSSITSITTTTAQLSGNNLNTNEVWLEV